METKKHALILGVANKFSIAYAICKKLLTQNYSLHITVLNDKVKEKALRLFDEKELSNITIHTCNLNNNEELAELFDHINSKEIILDNLVHSIAFAPQTAFSNPIEAVSKDDFLTTMETSCFSFNTVCNTFKPILKQGSSIITLTYLGSQRAINGYDIMGIAKAALEANTRYLAHSLGKHGIRVNAISAGAIKTAASSGIPGIRDMIKDTQEKCAIKTTLNTADVANAASLFLHTDANAITGQIIYVDNGASTI